MLDPQMVIVAKCFDDPRPSKTPSHKKAKNPINKVPATKNFKFSVAEFRVSVFDKISTKSTKKNEIIK